MTDEIRYPALLPQSPTQTPAQPPTSPHLAAILDQVLAARYMGNFQGQNPHLAPMWQLCTVAASGILLGATGYHVFAISQPPQVQVERQIQVVPQEKAVIVDRHCYAFCGK